MRGSWVMVGSDTSFDGLVTALSSVPGVGRGRRERARRRWLDTFDWRLHQAGVVLEHDRTGRAATLIARDPIGDVLARQPAAEAPRFADDIADGPVRELVAARLDVRALLVRAELAIELIVLPVLNRDDKTIARVTVERLRGGDRDLAPRVRIDSIRGYERAAARWRDRVGTELSLEPTTGASQVAEAFAAAGVVPGDYSSRFSVQLEPDEQADVALARLFLHLLDAMERNEDGVRDDTDTEFLHDFRVAIRRTRSLLPLARRCRPELTADLDRFADELRDLARATSEVRDLDVFLLGLDALSSGVAPEWRDDLGKLEPFAQGERERARLELLLALNGGWPELRDRWRRLLEAQMSPLAGEPTDSPDERGVDGLEGVRPPTIAAFARANIADAYRALTKAGRRITDDSPADDVHRVRKRAKVLRYQLEAFASVLPADELRRTTANLRRLQDVLGTFQDHDVQVHTIRDFTERLADRGDAGTDVLLAMGALRAHVREEREVARRRCAAAFTDFDRPANRRRQEALVAVPPVIGHPTTSPERRRGDRQDRAGGTETTA